MELPLMAIFTICKGKFRDFFTTISINGRKLLQLIVHFCLLIKKRRLQLSSQKVSEYESLKFLLPTSNILDRFFSSATYSFSDLRQKLLPMNLEMQLFLKVNEKFYD